MVTNCHFSAASRPAAWRTHPTMQWVPRGPSPAIKRQAREVDHSCLQRRKQNMDL
jgi:hypothetical protein